MLNGQTFSIGTLLRVFRWQVGLTWLLILSETGITVLIPLFIGFAIDGLLAGETRALAQLAALLFVLIVLSVIRRIYDTRVYGTMRVEIGKAQVARSRDLPVSKLNARLGMGRELADFLEGVLPEAIAGTVQFVAAIVLLYLFSPTLALAAAVVLIGMVLVYSLFHSGFYRWNGALNHQSEQQVSILETRRDRPVLLHLLRLRRYEVALSDVEAVLYGAIFILLLGMLLFNLWFATTQLGVTAGAIFSIVSYSWEFTEAALALPITLQSWSRLSEITKRLASN